MAYQKNVTTLIFSIPNWRSCVIYDLFMLCSNLFIVCFKFIVECHMTIHAFQDILWSTDLKSSWIYGFLNDIVVKYKVTFPYAFHRQVNDNPTLHTNSRSHRCAKNAGKGRAACWQDNTKTNKTPRNNNANTVSLTVCRWFIQGLASTSAWGCDRSSKFPYVISSPYQLLIHLHISTYWREIGMDPS